MSFKSALLKAFGFSSGHDYDPDTDDNLADYPSALPISRQTAAPAEAARQRQETDAEPAPQPTDADATPTFPLEIFDAVIELFNQAQPDFVSRCLDTEQQRRYIYERIDGSFKDYVASLYAQACTRADQRTSSAMRKVEAEADDMRRRTAEAEKKLEEQRQASMSAQRQKRALTERTRDLEQQLEASEAEKEQYSLEIKSLLNKLKVAQVQGAPIPVDAPAAAAQPEGVSQEEYDSLQKALEQANSQVSALNAKAMADEAAATRLKTDIERLRREAEARNTELAAAREEIATLRASLDQAEQRAVMAMAAQTPAPAAVPAQEEAPAVTPEPEPVAQPKAKRQRRKKNATQYKISAIDDTLDTTEWLIATPPEGTVVKPSGVSDGEFGYQEPPRRQTPHNDAQMSLFD